MPQLIVTAVLVEGRAKSEVARDYGVSRRWVITLVQRFLAAGETGLAARSRRPRSSPTRTSAALEDEIVQIRKQLDKNGHEAGAATIAAHLALRHEGQTPAVSTIWRILTARGFVTPQPHKRPKASYTRFAAEQPNERWQADITHWCLAGGADVEILNILDDHSRLCLASTTRAVFKAADVATAYRHTAARHGDPASMLTDNGAVFTGRYRGMGRVALELTLHQRGVVFTHSRPYHPQICGKVERFHQTLKKWLASQPPARRWPSCSTSSTPSPSTTTPSGPTARCTATPRPRPTEPGPAPRPAASRSSTRTTASATTRSTATANSPCATAAASTTSASAPATAAPPCSSWCTTCTCAS
jgi:transposase InsO family protein